MGCDYNCSLFCITRFLLSWTSLFSSSWQIYVSCSSLCLMCINWEMFSWTFLLNCKFSAKIVSSLWKSSIFWNHFSMLNKSAFTIPNIYNAKMGEEMNILQCYRQLVTLNHLMKCCTIKKHIKITQMNPIII